jgi:murein DD-endopeptidase MepM/ murein hydrolase activator NlpD
MGRRLGFLWQATLATMLVSLLCAVARADNCPLGFKAVIRPGDACAAEGGAFNARREAGRLHNALDLNATEGDSVFSIHSGKVVVAARAWGPLGNTVIVDHGDGDYSVYGHLKDLNVSPGDKVLSGTVVGTVGYSGNASCLKDKKLPPHLHLALFKAGKTGLAAESKPLQLMKEWGEAWAREFDAQLMGPVNPIWVVKGDCW